MPKDDYFAIVYKILEHLYACMRNGQTIDIGDIRWDSKAIGINEAYWCDIIRNMYVEGYIRGVEIINTIGEPKPSVRFSNLEITQKGIEFLQDNSKMQKASKCVNKVADILKIFV